MNYPLIGSSFVELPNELKNSRKGLINIKNNDEKCFLWCHVIHLNLVCKNPDRITKEDKKLADSLNYEGIKFPVSRKAYCKIEKQNNLFNYYRIIYPLYISGKKFSDCMDLLLIFDESKSHYLYIKDFTRLVFNETKNKKCCVVLFAVF